jgi:hypothetical protein
MDPRSYGVPGPGVLFHSGAPPPGTPSRDPIFHVILLYIIGFFMTFFFPDARVLGYNNNL